ncbi:trehalose/maltose hydrolase-like predicted phosphorylase [Arthrobacter pigmenti]|uniref:Trehalose/maltose hydrolase-like predicted phosphorylase n=1 Tax=Arthrobacter pigmenti TaxID=271432 RepID=A0A846RM32_9MICC|nr:trehalose/maltose hydrolase-like predicted phosphorylase [Arthrobacter pigmenti]
MPRNSSDPHPWRVNESSFDWSGPGVAESVFALANGYIGTRGTLDEVAPSQNPGTYMSGVFEFHPLSYPEDGYGHPERGQAIIGVADGTPIHLELDGTPFDLHETPPETHERTLDLRAGTLHRETEWLTPLGKRMRLTSTRLVSLTQRSITAIRYELEAVDQPVRATLRSELVVNRTARQVDNPDPRVGEALDAPFARSFHRSYETGGLLVHRTKGSGIGVAAMVEHSIEMPDGGNVSTSCGEDQVVTTVAVELPPGGRLCFTKYLSHVRSPEDSAESLGAQALAAMKDARERGWEGLLEDQRAFLNRFWDDADVEIDGGPELQLAIRFDLFHVLQASASLSVAPIGAKALTGPGYSGHAFWDVEGFVLPTLTLLYPEGAARLLRWRTSTLDTARERAKVLGVKGASFAWRTINGEEVSAYWPASTAATHLNAGIARAYTSYATATGTPLTEVGGVDVLVETARLWESTAHQSDDGRYHLLGVTGPDEYTGVVDDNVFTNLMAQRNLRAAADACDGYPDQARQLSVQPDEPARWRSIADAMYVPWDPVRQVHPANEGFTTYREWDFDPNPHAYPVQEHAHYAKIYRRQVVKQADLVLALWWCSEEFTDEQTARNLEYYEQRTVRDSSLSAAVQSVVCTRVGHLDLALAYLREAARTDLADLQGDTHRGVHLASLAGAWLALVSGFGGLILDGEELRLAPRLPATLNRIAFRLIWRGRRIGVEVTRSGSTVRLLDGDGGDDGGPVPVWIDGNRVELSPECPASAPLIIPQPTTAPPRQPPGREPRA